MNCDKIKSLVGWFHDGELDPADSRLVAEHLEHCPDCAAELAGLRELDKAGQRLPEAAVPADLWDRIASRLPGSDSATQPARNPLVTRRRFLLASGMLAAGIMVGVIAYGPARRKLPGLDGPKIPVGPAPTDPTQANLALLAPEDRRLVLVQRICVADGCGARLGADAPPQKVVLQNQPVFFCCKECAQWAREHPAQALAKLHSLEHRDEGSGKEP
jgi:Putative zinc-finger